MSIIWDGHKRAGNIELNQPYVDSLFPTFIKGHQFEEESFFTYYSAEWDSNIFVENGVIKAVQNGKEFIYNGINLISKPESLVIQILQLPPKIGISDPYSKPYEFEYESGISITLYCWEDVVRWVTISDWE